MYEETLCDATTEPTFAPDAIDPKLFEEMCQDFNDGIRNEAAITDEELCEMERIARAEQIQPKNEVRVGVSGRRFRAEARLAGGRWTYAGTHATEAAAWQAASDKLARLAGTERRTA